MPGERGEPGSTGEHPTPSPRVSKETRGAAAYSLARGGGALPVPPSLRPPPSLPHSPWRGRPSLERKRLSEPRSCPGRPLRGPCQLVTGSRGGGQESDHENGEGQSREAFSRKGEEWVCLPPVLRRAEAGSTPPRGGVALGSCGPGTDWAGRSRKGEEGVSSGLRAPRRREAGTGLWR